MSPRFMLDTDTVSFALRGQGRVAATLLEQSPSDLCMSSLTLAELRFGAEVKRSRKLHRLIDTFAESVPAVPFDAEAARRFGLVATALARAGTPIGVVDTLIAAQALALGTTLVSHNTQHFTRVSGLKLENWF
jgi:tRNA(fMet)-specific endonuclease VapC